MILFITYQVYHPFICFQAKLSISLACVDDRCSALDSPLTYGSQEEIIAEYVISNPVTLQFYSQLRQSVLLSLRIISLGIKKYSKLSSCVSGASLEVLYLEIQQAIQDPKWLVYIPRSGFFFPKKWTKKKKHFLFTQKLVLWKLRYLGIWLFFKNSKAVSV